MDVSSFLTTGNTLGAADLPQPCQTWTIAGATQNRFKDGDQTVCVQFHEHAKVLSLNKTNLKRLAGPPFNLGTNSDAWIGRQVLVYRTWTEYKGEACHGVRIWLPGQQPPEVIIDGAGNPAGFHPTAVQQPSSVPSGNGSPPVPQQPAAVQPFVNPGQPIASPQQAAVSNQQPAAQPTVSPEQPAAAPQQQEMFQPTQQPAGMITPPDTYR